MTQADSEFINQLLLDFFEILRDSFVIMSGRKLSKIKPVVNGTVTFKLPKRGTTDHSKIKPV